MGVRRAIVLAAAIFIVVGCAATPVDRSPRSSRSTSPPPSSSSIAASGEPITARPYAIGVGDRLRFDAPTVPELNETEATVRADGTVDLPLVGAIFAAGRTPAQFGSELQERLLRFYITPAVRVAVFLHDSQVWYAEAGNVRVTRPYTGRDQPGDALQIMSVRGFVPVRVLRPDETGKLHTVDAGNEPLEAGDVVQIGGGSVAKAGG